MRKYQFYNILMFSILAIFLLGCNNKDNLDKNNLLKYKIFSEKVTDTPGKTQILTSIILDQNDSITNEKITEILNHLYQERIKRTSFKYRENPNSVAISVYLSEATAESGAGQWIAMIKKLPLDSKESITFNSLAINSLNEKRETKWGLTYDLRQEIWNRIIFAERDSEDEAYKVYPLNSNSTLEDLKKIGNLQDKLKYEKEEIIMKDYKITKNILDSIGLEGINYNWAIPKR